MLTAWVAAAVGFPLYFLVPVAGPPFTFPQYYASIWPLADPEFLTAPHGEALRPRNCMPSVHAAWAYFVMFGAYRLNRATRLAVMAAAALTLVSAIEVGNHWFVDLVVALPFALAIQAMTSFGLPIWARQRLWALLGGVGMMVGLLALLYVQPLTFAYAVPFHWLVMVVVMVLSVGLWRRLAERMIAEADRPSLIAISRLRPTNEAA
jgi:hypothetical protein